MRESSLIWCYWRICIAPAGMATHDPSLYIVHGWVCVCTEGSTEEFEHLRPCEENKATDWLRIRKKFIQHSSNYEH